VIILIPKIHQPINAGNLPNTKEESVPAGDKTLMWQENNDLKKCAKSVPNIIKLTQK
jgi:hypothetical protein